MQKHHFFIISIIIFMGLVFGIYQYFQAFETENVSAIVEGTPNPGHTWASMECDSDTLCVDAANKRLGVGTNIPTTTLDVGGTAAIKIPVGTTAQRPTPADGMMRLNTTTGKLEYYNSGWNSVGGIVATGGTVTEVGGYRIHTFTSSGTFTITSGGSVEYLVVAGGGGGGQGYQAGGGGAGGFRTGSLAVPAGSITVTVGAGGAGGPGSGGSTTSKGSNGFDSVFSTITSIGGGGAGSYWNGTNTGGLSGGSGGGAGNNLGTEDPGGTGTSGQGYAGGSAPDYASPYSGGGGGGASGVGSNGGGAGVYGHGGPGINSSISGASVGYAGGGGAGTYDSGITTASYGGGAGGRSGVSLPVAGTTNTGGGGGGAGGTATAGANGGSGIVIIRYPM
jgi:hypothetical protein